MIIHRSGSQRFHGWMEIANREGYFGWDSETKTFTFRINRVRDANAENAYYDYHISISLTEVRGIIDGLSNFTIKDSKEDFVKCFAGMGSDFFRLMSCVSDIELKEPEN